MRLTYGVSLEDFRSLQPPFMLRSGSNAGFKAAVAACLLIVLLGVFVMIQGFGWEVGTFLVALGVIGAISSYFWDKSSVRKAERSYKDKLEAAYQHLHCKDQRVFEANADGFISNCNCGTVTRPWSELTQFSETTACIVLATKSGIVILPKSVFPSAAAITELRALVSEKAGRPTTARHVDFKCTKGDLRRARLSHVVHGGGWRPLLRFAATYAAICYGCFVIWKSTNNVAVLCGLVGGTLALPLLRFAQKRRTPQLLPIRIYFNDEGVYIQDPITQSRLSWAQFVGYLEGPHALLLYRQPRLYMVIPKRALIDSSAEFEQLIKAKLARFDYRSPSARQLQPAGLAS